MSAIVLVDHGHGEYTLALVNDRLWEQIKVLEAEQGDRLTDYFSPAVAFLVSDEYADADRPEGCPMRQGCVLRTKDARSGVAEHMEFERGASALLIVRP